MTTVKKQNVGTKQSEMESGVLTYITDLRKRKCELQD